MLAFVNGAVIDAAPVGAEVAAIAYSPNYQRDNTLIVVATTVSTTT